MEHIIQNFYLTEDEIKTSAPYKHFLELLLTKGSRLSTRTEDGVLFEFARVDAEDGVMYVLTTTDSRLWSLAFSADLGTHITDIIAYNKDLIEEIQDNG